MIPTILTGGASLLIAFALGSLPIGLWWGRAVRGIDVRQHGSRNLGATNVCRVLGIGHGIVVLTLDVLKGVASVVVAHRLTGSALWPLAAGLSAVLGHAFSPFVGFRGGKGVATALGVWLVIATLPTGIALLAWGITLAVTRRVSVASLVAATLLPVLVASIGTSEGRLPRIGLAILLAILVWIRHRGNLVRLSKGEEPPLWGVRRT